MRPDETKRRDPMRDEGRAGETQKSSKVVRRRNNTRQDDAARDTRRPPRIKLHTKRKAEKINTTRDKQDAGKLDTRRARVSHRRKKSGSLGTNARQGKQATLPLGTISTLNQTLQTPGGQSKIILVHRVT